MKAVIRVIALASVVPILLIGNSLPKNKTVAVLQHSTVPGPVPLCNPLTQTCPNIRDK